MNQNFWKNKTVFLTGHTGFKGSWLALILQNLGAKTIGFSNGIPTNPSLFELARVERGMQSIIGDMRNYEQLKDALTKHKPEIVIHMAAQSLVHRSYEDPLETYSSNVMGTVHLFEAVRKTGDCKVIINVTSDKCYQNRESDLGYSEEDPLGGADPYSNSKACAEMVTTAYRDSFFSSDDKKDVKLASVRAGNVIGGGDWAQYRLIPDMIRAHFSGSVLKIRNPDAIRHWQHVLDPLNGYLTLAERLWTDGQEFSGGWNFGPMGDAKPVSWIIDRFGESLGEKIQWEMDTNKFKHETSVLKVNSTKARTKLSWKSKIDLDVGIKLTAKWYKEYRDSKDMRIVTEEQINSFNSM